MVVIKQYLRQQPEAGKTADGSWIRQRTDLYGEDTVQSDDDPKKLGAPKDFDITVRNLKVSAGAGFIVALTGDIMTMPGLPKVPAAERIDVDDEGRITGLF